MGNKKSKAKYEETQIIKEAAIVGHSEPIKIQELNEIMRKEDSMCLILATKKINGKSQNLVGTGFFLNLNKKKIPFNNCLITNNHVLDEDNIKINNRIHLKYRNQQKEIEIYERRRVFTDKELDYTCIEILEEDNINHYFNIANNYEDLSSYEGQDIFILQYPNGNDLSFSSGKIKSIKGNSIFHTCSTDHGSSGSPIITRYSNSSIIGLHFGTYKDKNTINLSRTISSIINDIISKCKDEKYNLRGNDKEVKKDKYNDEDNNEDISVDFIDNGNKTLIKISVEQKVCDLIDLYYNKMGIENQNNFKFICKGRLISKEDEDNKIKHFISKYDLNIRYLILTVLREEEINSETFIFCDRNNSKTVIKIYLKKTLGDLFDKYIKQTRNEGNKLFLFNGLNISSQRNKTIFDFLRENNISRDYIEIYVHNY